MNMITRMYAPLYHDYMIAVQAFSLWQHKDGQASYLKYAHKAATECMHATNRKRSVTMWQERIVKIQWEVMALVQSVARDNGTTLSTGQLYTVADHFLSEGTTIQRAIGTVLGDVSMPVPTVKVPGKRGRKADPTSPSAIARVAREARKSERIAQGLPTRGRPRKVDTSTVASATKIAASLPSGILVDTREAYSGILGV